MDINDTAKIDTGANGVSDRACASAIPIAAALWVLVAQ